MATGLSSLLNPTIPLQINKVCSYLNQIQKTQGFFVLDISDESSEGGEIRCFYEKDVLRKIEIAQKWESGTIEKQLFFRLGQLLKAQEKTCYYNVPAYINEERANELGIESFDISKSKTKTTEIYFTNGKISQVVSDTDEESNSQEHEGELYYNSIVEKCNIVLETSQVI